MKTLQRTRDALAAYANYYTNFNRSQTHVRMQCITLFIRKRCSTIYSEVDLLSCANLQH